MPLPIIFTQSLGTSNATSIAQAQSTSSALAINGSLASGGVATLDTQRRVALQSVGNDSGITFTIKGTNGAGNGITEVLTGGNATTVTSNLDFKTITSIVPSGATATTVAAGTNGFGSSQWWTLDQWVAPFTVGLAVEVASGTATFSIQHTYDDPNNLLGGIAFPTPFNHPIIVGATTTTDSSYSTPVVAVRLLTTAGTGTLRARIEQAGGSGP